MQRTGRWWRAGAAKPKRQGAGEFSGRVSLRMQEGALYGSFFCNLFRVCLIGPLGMKRGRSMRQEYSTKWGRKEETLGGQGLSVGGFVGEWDYILGLAVGRCRGADAPYPTQGSLEKEKGLVLGKTKSEAADPGTRLAAVPEGGTHGPRNVVPRTPAKDRGRRVPFGTPPPSDGRLRRSRVARRGTPAPPASG